MRDYQDLSRRALIQLGHDYDNDNKNKLHDYLEENDERYEDIRFVEKVVEKTDKIAASLSGSAAVVKEVLSREADRILDTVIDSLSTCIKNKIS